MKSDEHFISALQGSSKFVSAVASWLAKYDCDVMIRPTLVRPSFELRNDYADAGDIEIRQRVEVKHRSIKFTSATDYPYETVIVDEKFKIDRISRGRLWGYVIVNSECTHACIVKPETWGYWTVQSMYDRKDKQDRDFYVCPKEHCRFCEIVI
jgi:hypothetical protein